MKCEVVRRVWWDGSPECGIALLVDGFDTTVLGVIGVCAFCTPSERGGGVGGWYRKVMG